MAYIYTQPEIIDRARLIALGAGVDPSSSPLNDSDYIAEVLYPHVVRSVFLREAAGGNPDVRAVQSVAVAAGTGTLPANVLTESLDTAHLRFSPQTVSGVTWVAATDIVTATAHGFWTGMPVTFSTTGTTLGGGLSTTTTYYVVYVTADTFRLETSVANAVAGSWIDISASAGDGTVTVTSTFTQGSFSRVPRYLDYARDLPTAFGYWNVHNGALNIRPAGTTSLTGFEGSVPFESAVAPRVIRKYTIASVTHASDIWTINSAIQMDDLAIGDRVKLVVEGSGTIPSQTTANTYYFVSYISGQDIKIATTYANAVAGTHLAFDGTTPLAGTVYFVQHDLGIVPGTPAPQDIAEDIIIELAKAMRAEPPYRELGNDKNGKTR